MIRLLPALAILLLAIAATWYVARRTAPSPTPPSPPAATATPGEATPGETAGAGGDVRTAGVAAAAATPSPGHRLAGTVVGDLQFAVIEAPDGSNELYAIDDQVPGLGKLVAIGPRSATFEGDGGRFDMELIAAATPTRRAAASEDGEDASDDYADEELLDEYDEEDWSVDLDEEALPPDGADTGY